jgi:hypothetical protein
VTLCTAYTALTLTQYVAITIDFIERQALQRERDHLDSLQRVEQEQRMLMERLAQHE